MKKLILSTAAFLLIFLISCNGKENVIEFPQQTLTKVDSIVLEENEDVLLSIILDCKINNSADKVVVISDNQLIVCYDYKNGKILHYNIAGLDLSDSILNYNRIPPDNPYVIPPRYCLKFMSIEECKKYGFSDVELQFMNNKFIRVEYNPDNTISSLALIYIPTLLKDDSRMIYNTAAVVEFDSSLKIKKVVFPNNTLFNFTVPDAFASDFFNKQYYITNETPTRYNRLKLKDSLPVLSIYDEKGEFIKTALFLDEQFIIDDIIVNNENLYTPSVTIINDKIFAMFRFDPNTLYDLISNKKISLERPLVDYTQNFVDYSKALKESKKGSKTRELLHKHLPICAVKLMNNGTNLIVCYKVILNDETSFIYRECDFNGKLISERSFFTKSDGGISNLLYDKINNYFVFFIKGEENWTMEKYRW